MKKAGIGCLVAVAVVVVLIGVGTWFVMQRAKDFVGGVTQLAEVSNLNEQIQNRAPYRPPADQRLDAAQVTRYVEIQRAMVERLGARLDTLDAKYRQLSEELEQKGREANLREVLAAWRDMIGLVVDAKRAQVDAINAAGLSLDEYNWIRSQVLYALGHAFAAFNVEQITADGPPPATPADVPPAAVREHNLELLEPWLDDTENWLPLSFFGL